MKITVFYSWQSDLASKYNRNLIETAIGNALKSIKISNKEVSEINLVSDSRDEIGTPDLPSSIFEKIAGSDIFVADISIINSGSNFRLTPNPNVLIELGYAVKCLGWSKVICVYNEAIEDVEKLPFDIRSRKPLIYNTNNELSEEKKRLKNLVEKSINEIIEKCYSDKKEYLISKRNVDVSMQAVLIDFCQMLFRETEDNYDKYNYAKLLNLTEEEIADILKDKKYLGFFLFRNIKHSIADFTNAFNDKLEVYFLAEEERKIIAKLIFALRAYASCLDVDREVFVKVGETNEYFVVGGRQVNIENDKESYILLKPINKDKGIVIAGGKLEKTDKKEALNYFEINKADIRYLSSIIFSIVNCVNLWIKQTGNYFIANLKD